MNESTAQANGQAPIERLVAVDDLRPMVAHEIARQLAVDVEPSWLRYTRASLGYLAMVSLIVIAVIAVAGVVR